jgi:two-component system cell cycle sensor histidine kinase/response regulator CckA
VTDGAVGRAVERRGVAWSVVTAQPGALRAEAAAAAGLKTAVAFPLFVQESLVGAFEFLARQAEPPDEELLRMLADLASQIGQLAERWHAVEALRHSKRWLNLALESARMGAWDLDLVTGSMSRSPNHDQVFGYETPLLRWSLEVFLSHVLPEDRDAVKAGFERALETGEFREECRIRWLDGSVHWIAEQGRVLRDEHGKPVRKVGVVTEITDLKAAAEAVRESEERHRALFDASPLPMWLYDRESLRILAVNDAAVRHYGYSRDEFLSMSLEDIRPTEDIPKLHADHVQEAPQYHSAGIWRHVKKNGTVIEVDVHVTDVAIGGRVLRLALLHDVTAQRRLEEQLRQAQKMDAVGRLAGGVAHDFNNLLTVINGYTELLLEHFPEDPEKRARTLGEIAKAGERAATLTRQLLAFSRKQVVAPRTVDLNKIVSGVESLLHRMIGEDVELVGSLAPRLWSVRADPGQIEQVIMNLAVNARDAMPRGGRLAIETRNVELDESYVREHVYVEPGPYVLLSVSDTGTGMDQETMRHIFEPFFTTKEQGKGTGLGLATVYGIVQQFGGHVWVYSEPEKGTSVKVYLPRVKKGVSSHPSMAQLPIPKPGTETVLLVEDEESIRRFAAEVLRASGYTVLEAPLPSSAIAMAESESGPIHVLLTDIVMPEMSGPDLAEAIKERHPATRPIFMSGYSNDAAVNQRLLEAGTAFLEKPFRPADLTRKVREVLEGKAG